MNLDTNKAVPTAQYSCQTIIVKLNDIFTIKWVAVRITALSIHKFQCLKNRVNRENVLLYPRERQREERETVRDGRKRNRDAERQKDREK